jgi:putative metallohydrolase (TIGR04338 family)
VTARFRYAIKRSPKSDPQQYRVYRMENEAIGARQYRTLSKRDIDALVRSVCRNYRVRPPVIVWKNLGRWAAEWSINDKRCWIIFNPKKGSAWDILTVLHELAHHVHECLGAGQAERHEAHGPEFMACYLSILDTCRVIPVVGMRAICAAWNVRYADPGTRNSIGRLLRIVRRLPSRVRRRRARGAEAK